jgi:hypothetical protein
MLKSAKNISVIEITKKIEPAFYRHIRVIAQHLRQADKDELSAVVTHSPEKEVFACCEASERKWIVIESEGNLFIPIALFGVSKAKNKERVGVPWMVATDGLKRIKSFMIKNSKKYINLILSDYDELYNFVDARNVDSIKWLKRCGFKMDEAQPLGHSNVPFRKFHMGSVK